MMEHIFIISNRFRNIGGGNRFLYKHLRSVHIFLLIFILSDHQNILLGVQRPAGVLIQAEASSSITHSEEIQWWPCTLVTIVSANYFYANNIA